MSSIAVDGVDQAVPEGDGGQRADLRLAPGRITGFLGANGAGKTTTMRMLVGLAGPTSGRATINGQAYRDLRDPLPNIGAMIERVPPQANPGATALRIAARSARIGDQRVEEVLVLVGLDGATHRRTRGYSPGMRQRLALAAALLGDPETLILDEPANGLDPQGIRWLRTLLRGLSDQGRTVFVSSHLLAELAQTVDDVVIIDHGRLVDTASPMAGLGGRTGAASLEGFFLDATSPDAPPAHPASTRARSLS